jgi:hypothetical protein
MKTKSCLTSAVALALATLSFLTGCVENRFVIQPAEHIATEHQSVAKGKIHLMPMKKDAWIIEVTPGVTNLDPNWASLKLKSVGSPDRDALKPSEFVTTADMTKLMQERTFQALQQAGFQVSEGDSIPDGADLVIAPLLQAAFVSLPSPSSPSAIVRVRVEIKNVKTGTSITTLIVGYGQSFMYFTLAQGLERAMDEAMENYQKHLIQDTKDFQGSL